MRWEKDAALYIIVLLSNLGNSIMPYYNKLDIIYRKPFFICYMQNALFFKMVPIAKTVAAIPKN